MFDRRSAVKLYRIVTAEDGVVNPDTSYCETWVQLALCRAVYGPFRAAVLGPAFTPGSDRGETFVGCQARLRASSTVGEQDARKRA